MASTADMIIAAEWMFFDKTRNIGGRADCQDDLRTFAIMRKSQLSAWDEATLSSYLDDLDEAERRGRNPISEKYGYMMEYSSPDEFKKIAPLLPAISMRKRMLAVEILKVFSRWRKDVDARYPSLARRSRPSHTRDDTPLSVSFETYVRGEIYTYSERTLELYKEHVDKTDAAGGNLYEDVLRATVRMQGYRDIGDAEAALKNRSA